MTLFWLQLRHGVLFRPCDVFLPGPLCADGHAAHRRFVEIRARQPLGLVPVGVAGLELSLIHISDDAEKTDSTAGESAKEESKVESEGSSEGNSSAASEAPASAAE